MNDNPDNSLEARLTAALNRLPDAPAPSNFTARVLEAVELEERQAERSGGIRSRWNWHWLLPRAAAAAAVLIFAGLGVRLHEERSQHLQLAKNLATVAGAPMPSLDALENLDAIQRMSQSGRADGELLAVLQ